MSLLKRWHLCQHLVRYFWERWSREYLCILNKRNKWRLPTRNVAVGDVVILQESGRVVAGQDSQVRVVSVKTAHADLWLKSLF